MAVSFKKLVGRLSRKPDWPVAEPEDSLGDSLATFTSSASGKVLSLEFSSDGSFYAETLDMRQIQDGKLVPLDSPFRKVVVPCVVLSEANLEETIRKLDAELAKL